MSVKLMGSPTQKAELTTPVGAPPVGYVWDYYKSDGKLYRKNSAGVETEVSSDEKVKVSVNDTTPRFLLSKLVAGDGIILTEQDDGDDESILISRVPEVRALLTNKELIAMVPGDVVVIDTLNDNSCLLGSSNGDTKIAGVVVVGAGPNEEVEVLSSGQTMAKVNGVISRGDSLASSTSIGRAKASGAAVNAVLGKALQANAAGDGTVDILVNLA